MKRNKLLTLLIGVCVILALVALPLMSACAPEGEQEEEEEEETELDKLREILNLPTGAAAGEGLKIKLGVSLPMSGGAEEYGIKMSAGVELGLKQIKALGGPEFIPTWYDIEMGVAERGIDAITDMAGRGIGQALVGWSFCAGAQAAGAEKYKILMLDGGGGTGPDWMGMPYAWGTRTVDSLDQVRGALVYCHRTHPEWKTVMSMGDGYGGPFEETMLRETQKSVDAVNAFEGSDFEYLGDLRTVVRAKDYSDAIAKINEKDPDILFMFPFDGPNPVLFMKQITTGQPIRAQCIGMDWSLENAVVAGETWKDYWCASPQFMRMTAVNPWAVHFVEAFSEEYGWDPSFFVANFYQDTFTMWKLVRDVIAKGGDPTSGPELEQAIYDDPSFLSVYGGDENTVGVVHWDVEEHCPDDLAIYMATIDTSNGFLQCVAEYGRKGTDFKFVDYYGGE